MLSLEFGFEGYGVRVRARVLRLGPKSEDYSKGIVSTLEPSVASSLLALLEAIRAAEYCCVEFTQSGRSPTVWGPLRRLCEGGSSHGET